MIFCDALLKEGLWGICFVWIELFWWNLQIELKIKLWSRELAWMRCVERPLPSSGEKVGLCDPANSLFCVISAGDLHFFLSSYIFMVKFCNNSLELYGQLLDRAYYTWIVFRLAICFLTDFKHIYGYSCYVVCAVYFCVWFKMNWLTAWIDLLYSSVFHLKEVLNELN